MSFNVSRITETLFVGGGIASDDELAYLKSQGVTAIISVAAGLDDAERAKAIGGVETLHIPWLDDGTPKDEGDFHRALAWLSALNAQRVSGGGRVAGVLAHCAAGCNRGPMMATFLLAAQSGLPADEAWRIVKGMRPVVTAFEQPQYRNSVLRALAGIMPVVTAAPEAQAPASAEVALSLDAEALATAEEPAAPASDASAAKGSKKG